MSTVTTAVHEIITDPKQIKIPYDGQLSKKGTVIKPAGNVPDIDYTIAPVVEKLNKAGFRSQFSCSGLKKDHPLKAVKPDGAYISFLYEENDPKRLNLIEKAAMSLNLTAEFCRTNLRPALIVRIDKDHSGSSMSDRIQMARGAVKSRYESEFRNTLGVSTKELDKITIRNGGLIYNTDEKLETVWNKFAAVLLYLNCQNAS